MEKIENPEDSEENAFLHRKVNEGDNKQEEVPSEILNERGTSPKKPVELVPPDGGWGWMVVLGGFITIVLGSFPLFSFSILFSSLLMTSGVSSAKIAWIFNMHGFIWSVYTIFIGPLSEEYGWRKISILGGIANFLSIFLSVFVTKADFLFITFSVLGGIGGSTGFIVCFLAVSKYFERRRGFATAITTLGSTVSSFLGPLVANYLLDNFGYMGASLIYSAIVLNQCVGGALFQPVEWHMKPAKCEHVSPDTGEELNEKLLLQKIPDSDNIKYKLMGEKQKEDTQNKFSASIHSIDSLGNFVTDKIPPRCKFKSEDNHGKVEIHKSVWCQFKTIMTLTYANLLTLKHSRVKIIAVAYGCLFLGYVNFQMWVPFIITNAGYTLEIAAWSISIGSIANAIGKLSMSLLSDRKWFNVRYGYMAGIFTIGISIIAFSFARKLDLFFTIACFWGFSVGVTLSLHTLVMIDIMGIDLLPALIGVASLFKGIINLIFGPLVGFVRDSSSSYTYAMCLLGAVDLLGFVLWLFIPLATRYDQKKTKKTPHSTDENS